MSEQKCGVRVVEVGVDGFHTIESEEDVQLVLMLMRKAAGLPHVQLGAVPEGWKLVPVEPTEQMMNDAAAGGFFRSSVVKVYRAMLAAAPSPSTQPHPEQPKKG